MDPEAVRANRRTWEAIAASFDATRRTPWRPVLDFLDALPRDARILDAGTGNGRHAVGAMERGLRPVGLDLSRTLLERAGLRAPTLPRVQGILERLPFRTGAFDAAICVAALHHVRGRANRVEALRELARVVRAAAPMLVTVWSLEQPRFRDAPPPAPSNDGRVEPGDALVRWTQHGLDVARFVHLYGAGELEAEAREAGWLVERGGSLALGGPEADNHFVLARAPSVTGT